MRHPFIAEGPVYTLHEVSSKAISIGNSIICSDICWGSSDTSRSAGSVEVRARLFPA